MKITISRLVLRDYRRLLSAFATSVGIAFELIEPGAEVRVRFGYRVVVGATDAGAVPQLDGHVLARGWIQYR
jgi:hypothetical protein